MVVRVEAASSIRSSASAKSRAVSRSDGHGVPRPFVTQADGTRLNAPNDIVTADDGSFDSGLFGQGETFSHTFSTPGTYPYYCIPHGGPGGAGMAGVVVVTEPQAALAAEAVATPAEAAAPASQSGDADSD